MDIVVSVIDRVMYELNELESEEIDRYLGVQLQTAKSQLSLLTKI